MAHISLAEQQIGEACDVGDKQGLYVSHPQNCEQYLQCVDGKFVERPCPPGLYWNNKVEACDWPRNAKCEKNSIRTGKGCLEVPRTRGRIGCFG